MTVDYNDAPSADEPDFATMTGLARGIRWSDVLADIEADERARQPRRRLWEASPAGQQAKRDQLGRVFFERVQAEVQPVEEAPVVGEVTHRVEPDLSGWDRRAGQRRYWRQALNEAAAQTADGFAAALAKLGPPLPPTAFKANDALIRAEAERHGDEFLAAFDSDRDADQLARHDRIRAAFDDPRRTHPYDPIRLSREDWEAIKPSMSQQADLPPWERPLAPFFGIPVYVEDPPTLAPETTPTPRGWLWRTLDRWARRFG